MSVRVLHVIDSLGSLGGGAERSTFELLPELRRRGIDSSLAVLLTRNAEVEEQLRGQGVEVHHLDGAGFPGRIRSMRRLITTLRPDLVHSTLYNASLVARLGAAGTGIPVATSLVNMPYGGAQLDDPGVRPRRLELARRIDAFTARRWTAAFHSITEAVKDSYVAELGLDPSTVTVVPRSRSRERLGVPGPERRTAARARWGVGPDQPLVVSVGRHEYQKAHATIVDAFALVRASHPDALLLVAGRSGSTTEALQQQIAACGLDGAVRLLGHVEEIPELLAAADVLAFASRFEGLGGSVLEALALEVPVVAADIPPVREILADGALGALVPVDDAARMAKELAAVLDGDPEARRRAQEGRLAFDQLYGPDQVADATAAWIRRVAAEHSRATGDDAGAVNRQRFDAEEVVSDYESVAATLTPAEDEVLAGLLAEGRRVLDLGVGTGRTVPALSAGASRYVGLDVAPRMVEGARRQFPDQEFVVGDAADLAEFDDGSFDLVVFSYNGIDYLDTDAARQRCWREVRRVLRDGGNFVFSSHNARAVLRRPSPTGGPRRLAVAAFQTAARCRRLLPSSSFWRGHGYVLDPVRGGLHTWTSTPRVVIDELERAGFVHASTVPGDHPARPRSLVAPWWYYAFATSPAAAS